MEGGMWWDEFFANRNKPCPFFVEWPDENLVEWVTTGLIKPGRALEMGCGNGRNAILLGEKGFSVRGIDFSAEAIAWAEELAKKENLSVHFECASIFDADIEEGAYDFVYDSGCFHHIPPHSRENYVDLVCRALKPGGSYGLVCFRPEGGSGFTDEQVYENDSLGGGLGYSEEQLRALWDQGDFSIDSLRQMRKPDETHLVFGEDFMWVLLAHKKSSRKKPNAPTVR